MNWNGTEYYYLTNIQDDIVALLDESGNFVVQYSYDAWGNPLSTTGSMAETLGSRNSLRYRGYVFDDETELYYLQSRYYDPETCRFINSDSFIATGQGLIGNNMFIYCGNNPVSRMDPIGKSWLSNKWNSMCNFFEDVYKYVSNSDEEAVRKNLKKDGFSFYKYTPVFSAPLPFDGSAFSFGIIVMDDYYLTHEPSKFAETINHEYGHAVHLMQVGLPAYTVKAAIPSLAFAGISNAEIPVVSQFVYNQYYNLPWERTADFFGGVERQSHNALGNFIFPWYWLSTFSFP